MAWNLGKYTNLFIQLAIAFLAIGIIYAQVAKPQLDNGINEAIAAAQAVNYTATESALNAFSGWITTGLTLIILGATLLPLVNAFINRKGASVGNLVGKVMAYSITVLIMGVLFFGIGLKEIINAQVISDSMLAGIISLSGVGILFIGVASLGIAAVGGIRRRRKSTKSETPAIRVA